MWKNKIVEIASVTYPLHSPLFCWLAYTSGWFQSLILHFCFEPSTLRHFVNLFISELRFRSICVIFWHCAHSSGSHLHSTAQCSSLCKGGFNQYSLRVTALWRQHWPAFINMLLTNKTLSLIRKTTEKQGAPTWTKESKRNLIGRFFHIDSHYSF